MSSKKVDRALYGPSWTEVIFGAILSFGVGLVLALVFLILKPVQIVKELPKEPVRGVVYYIEGSKDTSKARQTDAKLKLLNAGQSATLSEDELNSLLTSPAKPADSAAKGAPPAKAPAPAPAKAPAPGAKAPPAAPGKPSLGTSPNFRINDGTLQIGIPTTLDLLGLNQQLLVMATGKFSNEGGKVGFDIETFRVGSLQVERLPFIKGAVMNKILAAQTFPEDLAAIWGKLASISIEGKTLKLTMP